jgi:transposase-like protein
VADIADATQTTALRRKVAEIAPAAERSRRWRYADKVWIVEKSFAFGASVSAFARRNGLAASMVFTWRRQAKQGELGGRTRAVAAAGGADASC